MPVAQRTQVQQLTTTEAAVLALLAIEGEHLAPDQRVEGLLHARGQRRGVRATGPQLRVVGGAARLVFGRTYFERCGVFDDCQDLVKAIGTDVLRHRVILTYEAEAEEMTATPGRPGSVGGSTV